MKLLLLLLLRSECKGSMWAESVVGKRHSPVPLLQSSFLFHSENMPITESITHLLKVMVGCKREYRKFSYSSPNVFLLILGYSLCSTINSSPCLGWAVSSSCAHNGSTSAIWGIFESRTFQSIKSHHMSTGFYLHL